VAVRILEEVMLRLEKQFELLPSRTPVVQESARLSPEERKKCFPECN
jgi:hypothetical protein